VSGSTPANEMAIGAQAAAVLIEPFQAEAGIFPIADEVLVAALRATPGASRRNDGRQRAGPPPAGRVDEALGLLADTLSG
jgi:hypothetical protein